MASIEVDSERRKEHEPQSTINTDRILFDECDEPVDSIPSINDKPGHQPNVELVNIDGSIRLYNGLRRPRSSDRFIHNELRQSHSDNKLTHNRYRS
jgi:hypothetical protein